MPLSSGAPEIRPALPLSAEAARTPHALRAMGTLLLHGPYAGLGAPTRAALARVVGDLAVIIEGTEDGGQSMNVIARNDARMVLGALATLSLSHLAFPPSAAEEQALVEGCEQALREARATVVVHDSADGQMLLAPPPHPQPPVYRRSAKG